MKRSGRRTVFVGDGGEMRTLAMFGAVMVVAYVVGRHLVPSTAIDAAVVWAFGLLSMSPGVLVLG